MLMLTVMAYGALFIYEFIPLYKQKQWRDFWINAILGTFSFAIAIMLCLGIRIPSPEAPIRTLITSAFGK